MNEITSNHYIQTKFPKIQGLLSDAISRLDSKIDQDTSLSESNNTVPAPGSGNPVINPYPEPETGKVPYEQPTSFNIDEENFSNQARTILEEIEVLEKIANSNEDKFKQQWPNLYKIILKELDTAKSDNKISIAEESDIRTKLTNLDKYFPAIKSIENNTDKF